tara:strand:+ start:194 stop:433 length:240 start_codon:yes stop_codon:yes gene_type:complete
MIIPVPWLYGKNFQSMNTPPTLNSRRKESQLIMEPLCNASANIHRKTTYSRLIPLVVKSTVNSFAITTSPTRMFPRLWD